MKIGGSLGFVKVLLWLFTSLVLTLSAVGAEPVKIRKITITGNTTTQTALIAGMLVEAREGDLIESRDLDALGAVLTERLSRTGYFSSVLVSAVPSAAESAAVNLVVEVEEGFLGRFGGGPVYATAGWLNAGGQGRDFIATVGWNRQALEFADHAPGWRGGSYRLLAFHNDDQLGGRVEWNQEWGWGWFSRLASQGQIREPRPDWWQSLTVGLRRVPADFSPASGLFVSATHTTVLPSLLQREEAEVRTYALEPSGFVKVALRAYGGVQGGTPAEDERYLLTASGPGAVRKVSLASEGGSALGLVSAELRGRFPSFGLLGFIPTRIEPVLLVDLGWVYRSSVVSRVWAWGGGVRMYCDAPVDLPIRFEVTRDNQDEILYLFAVEAPF